MSEETKQDNEEIKEHLKLMKHCSICGDWYKGWGNNAQPIDDGRCCDDCNNVVVKRRINDLFGYEG